MYKFIYVLNGNKARELEAKGFNLIKKDEEHNVYVFENKIGILSCFEKKEFVLSNTLTF